MDVLLLRIRVPKRTRWAPHDEAHHILMVEKVKKSLARVERCPGGEERLREVITLFNDLIAQPILLASSHVFRTMAVLKMDECAAWVKNNKTRFEDEFRDTEDRFHELLTELHDHPLFQE
jgi:hypothetical protein